MKPMILGLILTCFAGSTFALDKQELDNRIRTLTARLDALQQKPGKSIPADYLSKAQGVILMERTKAGFLFAYQGGGGVALVKDPTTAKWSPVAFLSAQEASLGFQIGGQQSFFVILLMNTNATRLLTEPNFEFGGEARGTAGNETSGVAGTFSSTEQAVVVYDDRTGLYGGAALKGGAMSPDEQANRIYYGDFLTMNDILFQNKVKPSDAASALAVKLTQFCRTREK